MTAEAVAGAGVLPLTGLTLATGGTSPAVEVAARHLGMLGAAVATGAGSVAKKGTGAGAGTLTVRRPGARQFLTCAIDWAGPVSQELPDELAVQAACGIMHVHGRRFGVPTPLCVDYAGVTAGVLAAQAVLAGLLANARGMRVERARTSVAQAALLAVSQYLASATADDPCPPCQPGGPPFNSADGVPFEIETLDAEHWQRFWELLVADPCAIASGWGPFQQRFATATCPLPASLAEAAGRLDFGAAHLAARSAGVSVMRVRHVPASRPGAPWRVVPMSGRGGAMAPPRGRLPLGGLVVVEATNRVQGPLAGHLLGQLGARVLRIEPPDGDPSRGAPPMVGDCSARFLALNRGKEVVRLDLKSPAGRRQVLELVGEADVFLHNWAPGRAWELALEAGHLAAARPGLVYASASGWGDEFGARPPLGTDFLVQAYSGLAGLVRPAGEPAAPSLMTLTDVLGGLVCVQGVLAALIAKIHTGRGQRVDSSLLSAADVLCQRVPPLRPLRTPVVTTPCVDLAALATDPRFADAIELDGAAFPRPPWEFR